MAPSFPHADTDPKYTPPDGSLDAVEVAHRAVLQFLPDGRLNRIPAGLAGTHVAVVSMNHGRWVVECPLEDPETGRRCGGAQLAAKDDPRFFCVTCQNNEVDAQFLPVYWPTDDEIGEIEYQLGIRPIDLRNWIQAQPVAELAHENDVLGLKHEKPRP